MDPMYSFKADVFKTLGHPVRLQILDLLRDREQTVSELQQALRIEASSVSQQLAVMRAHQLVTTRKSGTSVYYRIQDPTVLKLLDIARTMFKNQVAAMTSILDDSPS